MAMLHSGKKIRSTGALRETFFEDAIIFIAEHNEHGTIGFVINKPYGRNLNELEEFRGSVSFPLHDGGPMDREHIYVLHKRPDLIEGGTACGSGMYYGGRFADVLDAFREGTIAQDQVQLLIGYCGWDKDELEAEIREGSWEIV